MVRFPPNVSSSQAVNLWKLSLTLETLFACHAMHEKMSSPKYKRLLKTDNKLLPSWNDNNLAKVSLEKVFLKYNNFAINNL